MPVEDLAMTRRVQREFARRQTIDGSLINVRAIHGVVYVTGRVRSMRGGNVDLKHEMGIIALSIRKIAGVRDVVLELMY